MNPSDLLGEFRPTERERTLYELARRYHDECEAYDRTVCTGPVIDGAILPATPHERALVIRNAANVRRSLIASADLFGITAAELHRAIARAA